MQNIGVLLISDGTASKMEHRAIKILLWKQHKYVLSDEEVG
jgi:hypothetical protein